MGPTPMARASLRPCMLNLERQSPQDHSFAETVTKMWQPALSLSLFLKVTERNCMRCRVPAGQSLHCYILSMTKDE